MKKITIILLTLMGLTTLAHSSNENTRKPWMVSAAFGMANYSNAMDHDGQVAVGRFSLGRSLFHIPIGQIYIEAGIQSGNTMHLNFPKEDIDALGGVPIEARVKPLLDMLIGFDTKPIGSTPFNISLKGGVTYRILQPDRKSVNDINQFSPEIQVGFGYRVSEKTTFNIGYQWIGGKEPVLTINSQNETGKLQYMPMQETVLIGFSFNLL